MLNHTVQSPITGAILGTLDIMTYLKDQNLGYCSPDGNYTFENAEDVTGTYNFTFSVYEVLQLLS